MAPLTTDARGDLEEGGVIVSEKSNTTDKATQAENRHNEWLNSRTRGLWWVWLCLFAVSGLVAICSDYSEEEGQLPSAAKWIQRIATVLMVGSYGILFWHNHLGSDGRVVDMDRQSSIQIDRQGEKQQTHRTMLTIVG
jgi:hypothetical protein